MKTINRRQLTLTPKKENLTKASDSRLTLNNVSYKFIQKL